jgi:hypothetical protein
MPKPYRDTMIQQVGLPLRPFLYTLDQVADMLSIRLNRFKANYVYFAEIHSGPPPPRLMVARNISPDEDVQEWRIIEPELVRWLRHMGYRIYDPTVVKS